MQGFTRPPRKIFVIDTRSDSGLQKPDQQTSALQQLRPILSSLYVLGLYSCKQEHTEEDVPWFQHVSPWTCVVLALLCAYVMASATSCVSGLFWVSAFSFLKTASALLSSLALIMKEGALCQLIWRLNELPSSSGAKLRRTAAAMVACVWAFVLLRTSVQCVMLFEESPEELSTQAASTWFGVDGQLPASVLLPLSLVDTALRGALVDGSLLTSIALYLALTIALRHRYVNFNTIIARHALRGSTLETSQLQRLRLVHTELGSAVRCMDAAFAPAAFLWVSLFVFGVCVEVSRFLGHRRRDDRHELVIFGLNLVSVTLPFLLLSILASQLTEAAHASAMPLHRCLDKGSAADGDMREGRLLASQLRAPYVALTGWGFFAFSRSFVLTLAGALISYVVILLQLNPATNKAPAPVAGH